MKTIRLFSLVMLGMALILASCSGKDGEQGPQGLQGVAGADGADGVNGVDGANGISCWDLNGNGSGDADEDVNNDGNFDALDCQGVDGTNGTDGTNGLDGNANVQQFVYDITLFGDYSNLKLDLLNYVNVPENYAYLYYIVDFDGKVYSIPGPIYNIYYATVYHNQFTTEETFFYIDFFNTSDDAAAVVPNALFTQVIVVAMELTNGAKNSEGLLADLKAVGVDTSDYQSVVAYFGLE